MPEQSDPVTPDELIHAFNANWSSATEAWGGSLGATMLRRDDVVAVNVGRPAFVVNAATLLSPLGPDMVDETMAALDDLYGFPNGARTGRVLLFSAWPTPDLTPYGWTTKREAPLMFRPAGGEVPQVPSGFCVEPVHDAATLRAAEEVTIRGFGPADPELHEPEGLFGRTLLDDARIAMWIGREGDRPVSTSATFIANGVNNIINVATVPEARRRGYGRAVTWPATVADPSLPAILVASDQGQPVYEKMGYTKLLDVTLWVRKSPVE